MNSRQQNHLFNRRTLIKGATAALGLTTLAGCQAEEVASQVTPESISEPAKTPDSGCRLYKVIPAVDKFYTHTSGMKPVPMMFNWSYKRHQRGDEAGPSRIDYFVWAKPAEAAAIGEHESVKAIEAVLAANVVVLGDSIKSEGTLSVKLFPNSAWGKTEDDFASTEDVIKSWQEQLKDVSGVKISSPPEPKQPMAYGERADKGQVVIEFTGEQLNAKVLEVVKSHPQTLAIKWGRLFSHFYCPGCGMG